MLSNIYRLKILNCNLIEYYIHYIYFRDFEEKLAFSESKNMALQKRVDELEEILGISDKYNNELEIKKSENKNNVSKENLIESSSKKSNQNISSTSTLLSCTKQKIEKV